TRLREQPLAWSMVVVIGANVAVFWALANAAADGSVALGTLVVYAMSAIGTSMIAFGGLSWAMDGVAAPVAAVLHLGPDMARIGALASGSQLVEGKPSREIRFRDV